MDIGYNSEYGRLKSVALHFPRENELKMMSAKDSMYVKAPDYKKVLKEFQQYVELLWKLDIDVYTDSEMPEEDIISCPNSIYMRDIAGIMPDAIILGNPKYDVRKPEKNNFKKFLEYHNYTGNLIDTDSEFEGADMFWTKHNEVTLSVGNRTSLKSFDHLKQMYSRKGIKFRIIAAAAEGIPQHLLGAKHIVSKDTLISRASINPSTLGFKNVIELDETPEVIHGYAMNVVTVGPNEIIMPEGNPETMALFEDNNIICHTTPMYEICKMAGGPACMTLPLKRKTI